ncbi:MAG: hypothetical protein ACK52I_09440 [Pseudomonadota bacterium]|jgi:hypothetical protein
MSENQTFGSIPVYPKREWLCFDLLPKPLREVFQRAPFEFAIAERFDALTRMPVEEARRALIEHMCDTLQRECLKTYGPDHPDAQISRLDRKRRIAA